MKHEQREEWTRQQLVDLTDAADWPNFPKFLTSIMDTMDVETYQEMDAALDDWRADIVKATAAAIVESVQANDVSWLVMLAAVLKEDPDEIVTQLECDNALTDHDDVMLEELADPYNPREHSEYIVRFRADEMDDMMLPIRDGIARKLDVGCATIRVEQVEGGHETCPLVSITLPLSDARELAK